jgi:hypothetical protein
MRPIETDYVSRYKTSTFAVTTNMHQPAIIHNDPESDQSPSAVDRRGGTRIQTDDLASLELMTPATGQCWDVRIANVSKDGMCVQLPVRLQRGSGVKIRRESLIVFGSVHYCIADGARFLVGIKLSDVF